MERQPNCGRTVHVQNVKYVVYKSTGEKEAVMRFGSAGSFRRAEEILAGIDKVPAQLASGDMAVLAEASQLLYVVLSSRRGFGPYNACDTREAWSILTMAAKIQGQEMTLDALWEHIAGVCWTIDAVCHHRGRPAAEAVQDASALCEGIANWLEQSLSDTILPGT